MTGVQTCALPISLTPTLRSNRHRVVIYLMIEKLVGVYFAFLLLEKRRQARNMQNGQAGDALEACRWPGGRQARKDRKSVA